MKNIFDLFNEQNPPEQKPVVAENVVQRDASKEEEKVVPKETPKEEQAQKVEEKTTETETEKGGNENGSIEHNPAEPVPA